VSGRPNDLAGIDAASWAEALRRDQVLRPLAESDGPVSRSEAGAVANRLGISQRWAFALLRRLRADLRTSALLARDRGRPRGLRMLQPEVEAVVEGQVSGYYATVQKPSKQDLFEAIRHECRRRGLRPPGKETIRRRLRAMDPVAIAAGRLGRKAARNRHGPAKEHFEPSTQLLGLVEIDHTRVDLIVVDDAYREPIGRPWLTLAIDVLSRVVVGYYLTLEAPSSLSVALCMAHMVGDKALWLAHRGLKASWPGGLPTAIHLDNAAEFHADALVRGCEEHGIIVNYRPVATPHYGGHIERLVGTMMGDVHLLPGTTFSNVAERGEYDSERHAAMTVAETDLWLTRQIAVLYHGAPHKGLGGRTPVGVWDEAVADGRGPRTAPDPGRVRLDFLPFELRQPRRDGIELFKLGYWHDALPALAARGKAKLPVRYDPRDMSQAWLRPAGEPDYLELRLKDLRRPAVTLWEWQLAGKRLRAQGRREVDEEAQFEAVEANRLLVADAQTKTSRRQAQRRAAARKESASTAAGVSASDGTASGPDYSKPPKLYDVEEWS
jgi:putative transposase